MGSLIFYSIMQVSYAHILLVLTRRIINTYWNRIWHLHLVPRVSSLGGHKDYVDFIHKSEDK